MPSETLIESQMVMPAGFTLPVDVQCELIGDGSRFLGFEGNALARVPLDAREQLCQRRARC